MNYVLLKEQLKRLFEQSDRALEPIVVKLFKFLNEEKKGKTTRAALLDQIKNIAPYLGLPEGFEIFYLELYLLNYRPDGDYSNLTKDNFVDPRQMKGKWTPNTKADLYTRAQLPFRGSNLEGYWDEDNKGVPYYVVKSYGWYPIYIFKNNKWYEVIEKYSSSTSRQISNANPVEWEDDLGSNVILVTRKEMELLQRNATFEDIISNKRKSIKSKEKEFQDARLKSVAKNQWWWDEQNRDTTPYKAKFKINSIDDSGEKVIVNVDIHDVVRTEKGKAVKTPENYLKGELKGVTPEKVENALQGKLNHIMRDYIGPRYRYNEQLPSSSVIEYKFNHLKK